MWWFVETSRRAYNLVSWISIQLCLHYLPSTAAWVFCFYILVLCVLETLSTTLKPLLRNTKIWALSHIISSLWDREQYLCLTLNLAWISESDSLPDYCLHWVKWAATMPDFFSCFAITWLPRTCKKEKYLFHGKRWARISTPCALNLESWDLILNSTIKSVSLTDVQKL